MLAAGDGGGGGAGGGGGTGDPYSYLLKRVQHYKLP